jgi:hypothetical protein
LLTVYGSALRIFDTQRNTGTFGDVGLGAATFKVSNGWMVQYDAESSGNSMSKVLASVATDKL